MSDRTTDYMIYYSYSCGILKVANNKVLKLEVRSVLHQADLEAHHARWPNQVQGEQFPLCSSFICQFKEWKKVSTLSIFPNDSNKIMAIHSNNDTTVHSTFLKSEKN